MSGSKFNYPHFYKGQVKNSLGQVGLTPCQMFYFFFAAFTGFFALAFLTIFNMKICLLLYKFMLVDLSYLPFTKELFETALYFVGNNMQDPTIRYLIYRH